MLPHEVSTLSMRRNSLPPLRNAGTTSISGANTSSVSSSDAAAAPAGFNGTSGGAAKATAALAAASLGRSGSFGRLASPGSIQELASTSPAGDSTAAGVQHVAGGVSSMLEGPLQISSSFARVRSCSGALGPSAGGTVVDVAAMIQLSAVRQAQAMAHR